MDKQRRSNLVITAMMALLLSFTCELAVAANGTTKAKPAGTYGHTPEELAARREMVRRQQEQRITPEKRQAAVEALKAERLRVYKAKQAVQQTAPGNQDHKK